MYVNFPIIIIIIRKMKNTKLYIIYKNNINNILKI